MGIVVPIIFNLDAASFLAVMNQDSRSKMFLQPILQIFDGGGGRGVCGGLAPATGARSAELPSDQTLRPLTGSSATVR